MDMWEVGVCLADHFKSLNSSPELCTNIRARALDFGLGKGCIAEGGVGGENGHREGTNIVTTAPSEQTRNKVSSS